MCFYVGPPLVGLIIEYIFIEFGLQAKPSNLYREFVLLAAPRDDDNDLDLFYNLLRLINVIFIAVFFLYRVTSNKRKHYSWDFVYNLLRRINVKIIAGILFL